MPRKDKSVSRDGSQRGLADGSRGSQFKQGAPSANPRGRPRRAKGEPSLGKMLTSALEKAFKNGGEEAVTARLTNLLTEPNMSAGDVALLRVVMNQVEAFTTWQGKRGSSEGPAILSKYHDDPAGLAHIVLCATGKTVFELAIANATADRRSGELDDLLDVLLNSPIPCEGILRRLSEAAGREVTFGQALDAARAEVAKRFKASAAAKVPAAGEDAAS